MNRWFICCVLAGGLVACGAGEQPKRLGEWVLVEGINHCIPVDFSSTLSITEDHVTMRQDFPGCQFVFEAPYIPDVDAPWETTLAEGRDCDSCGRLFRVMEEDARNTCEPLACLAELPDPHEGIVQIGQCPSLHNFSIGGAYLFNTRGDDELLMNFGFFDAVMVFRRPELLQ